jgi:cold shock protein
MMRVARWPRTLVYSSSIRLTRHGGIWLVKGMVKWFDDFKGFGFVVVDGDPRDVFVHHSAIITDGYATLQKGSSVEFVLVEGARGPVAQSVRVLS